jgi:hypothetical protein
LSELSFSPARYSVKRPNVELLGPVLIQDRIKIIPAEVIGCHEGDTLLANIKP